MGVAVSTLNVALPVVVRHFDAPPFAASWILLSFMLVNTATLVFFGRVADLLSQARGLPGRVRAVHGRVGAGRAGPERGAS